MRKAVIVAAVIGGVSGLALARRVFIRDSIVTPPNFALQGSAVGGTDKAAATPAFLAGTRIAAVGEGALVVDPDSGKLVRVSREGKPLESIEVARDAGLLVYDAAGARAYVADRAHDRIAVISTKGKLSIATTFHTPVEPYGVALTPDRKLLLVTTIADRTLVALDTATGAEKWRAPLGREPRGLAVSPDGKRAVVAYLATGTVDDIDLGSHAAHRIALSTTRGAAFRRAQPAFARAAFAVTFMGASEVVVPFQRETPVQIANGRERTGSYGGGFEPPVTHQVAFIDLDRQTPKQVVAQIAQHQPRAVAWDGAHDALYVAGLGNDMVARLKDASTTKVQFDRSMMARDGKSTCGADGLAVTPSGDVLVWCSFTRTVNRISFGSSIEDKPTLAVGEELAPTRMTAKQHDGYIAFHVSDAAISQRGAMACATCHPDGRDDGLSWRIEKHELQTPLLAGRLSGTHPYKWDGGDKDLATSLKMTMKRLGGFGLDAKRADALQAYVEMLPKVRTPTRDVAMVKRGKQLFDSHGCRQCHDGPAYADNEKHAFTGSLPEADTPSLIGLSASAPYFHDGSAPTLEALLRDRGSVHGMGETSKLSDAQISDLTAFLETL